jgi:hypothetical protein
MAADALAAGFGGHPNTLDWGPLAASVGQAGDIK